MKILVTGGSGFIGSHLVDALVSDGNDVKVLDINLDVPWKNPNAEYIKADIVKNDISDYFSWVDVVFHLAADPMVDKSAINPENTFNTNVVGTYRVLEACRKNKIKHILFTSTSTVYGEAKVIPTPEDYPTYPISNYGASKLANEAFISSYAYTYGFKASIFRLANIFGERSTHGVMFDFYHKLMKNPNQLEILGDGKQEKSYLHVSDCVNAMLTVWKKQEKQVDYFNVGSDEKIIVDEIARQMSKILGLNPTFKYTGGKRGWVGDVPVMMLDISRLKTLGWKPNISFEEGLKRYIQWLGK